MPFLPFAVLRRTAAMLARPFALPRRGLTTLMALAPLNRVSNTDILTVAYIPLDTRRAGFVAAKGL